MTAKLDFPATERNREPIAQTLGGLWSPALPLRVLEVAAGSGQHAVFFAERFPLWSWQPTDVEPSHLASISAYRREAGLENLLEPVALDVAEVPWSLPGQGYDAILAINLIHISPWTCTEQLFAQGREHLRKDGGVFLYGAFRREERHTSPSNEAFDAHLRAQDPRWGVRCLDEVTEVATGYGFRRDAVVAMPANNLSVRFLL